MTTPPASFSSQLTVTTQPLQSPPVSTSISSSSILNHFSSFSPSLSLSLSLSISPPVIFNTNHKSSSRTRIANSTLPDLLSSTPSSRRPCVAPSAWELRHRTHPCNQHTTHILLLRSLSTPINSSIKKLTLYLTVSHSFST